MWYLGNTAPDEQSKQAILDNIREEFGGRGKSHERLYADFTQSLGVDLTDEVLHERTYLPFARAFNKEHLIWLHNHDWDSRTAAFSAYERLDNVDYEDLFTLAKNLGVPHTALRFFEVHKHVTHYEMASSSFDLGGLWGRNSEKVMEAYQFIGDHQNKMWSQLSDEVLGHSA